MSNIFDKKAIKSYIDRNAKYSKSYLQDEVGSRMFDNISILLPNKPSSILLLSSKSKYLYNELSLFFPEANIVVSEISVELLKQYANNIGIQCDPEFLPFKNESFDLVISTLGLHCVNDLVSVFKQIKVVLRKDGVFMASVFGGKTLSELREVFIDIESREYSSISPRIGPFIDTKDAGRLLQAAGFEFIITDSDIIEVSYNNAFSLMYDIKHMGNANSLTMRQKNLSKLGLFFKVNEQYNKLFSNKDGEIYASFEIVSFVGRNF